MAFALSSLLNPASTENNANSTSAEAPQESPSNSPIQTHGIAPSVHQLPSPELLHAQLPKYTPPQRPRPSSSSGTSGGNASGALVKPDASGDHGLSLRNGGTGMEETISAEGTTPNQLASNSSALQFDEQYRRSSYSPEQRRIDRETQGQMGPPSAGAQSVAVGGETAPGEAGAEMSNTATRDEQGVLTPTMVKQEADMNSRGTSPADARHLSTQSIDVEQSSNRSLTSLKHEHASRTQSPLRESSISLPNTEEQNSTTAANMKKRTAPAKSKKGTATTAKKTRAPTKKRKTDKLKPPGTRNAGLKTNFSPAPSDTHSVSGDVDVDDDEDEDESAADSDDDVEGSGDVYCICRKPDNGTFMIGCDGQCDDWFHGKCVGIEERNKNLIDKYICPRCTDAGVGRTSWKRMCRRLGCRQPARVGRNAHKDGTTSKYCSDECGVLFFREMTARTRGGDQAKKNRRKSGVADDHTSVNGSGLTRGGPLSAAEVKTLLDLSDTAVSFKSIGNGVLSPPATPDGDSAEADSVYTDIENTKLKEIETKKNEARLRHRSLKDRLTFVGYVKAEATRVAAAKDLKPKEYCGFDQRINWSEEEFSEWRQSPHGQETFDRETLEPLTNGVTEHGDGGAADVDPSAEAEESAMCSRKKCARHTDWSKLAVDNIRFEMTDNSDRMRRLEQQEQDIRLQATMRAKHPRLDDGSVEWHHTDNTVNGVIDNVTNGDGNSGHSPMQIENGFA